MKTITRAKLAVVLATAGLAIALAGCENFFESVKEKSVAEGSGGLGGKFTTSIDATTGTPTPAMTMGEFQQHFISHRPEDGDLMYYKEEKSMWGSEVGSRTFVWMKKGISASVEAKPDQLISIPGLNVVAGADTVKISALPESAASDSASFASKLSAKAAVDSGSSSAKAK